MQITLTVSVNDDKELNNLQQALQALKGLPPTVEEVVVEKPSPKGGKKTSKKASSKKTKKEPVEEPKAEPDENLFGEDDAPPAVLSLDDMKVVLKDGVARLGHAKVKEALLHFGVGTIKELPEDKRGEFATYVSNLAAE